ncbi:C1 family peptidase [Geomonas oryzae]|uniref:C1 family peptidase n=1 Tax=Geomonas oryzae TaxID=2364273 RepID=UPI00100B6D02|nr:C1 family peptidase [Geomonas oryzae]
MTKGKSRFLPKTGMPLFAIPDPIDFRDLMYLPTLVEVQRERPVEDYLSLGIPVLDQKETPSCTGFALATVVHTLVKHRDKKLHGQVSPQMLYEMAQRYDEWPGEKYDGSSARGAIKGWHKHGVCKSELWHGKLTPEVSLDALSLPLGAYYRVNHKDLVALHAAITEVGILYATTLVHSGWDEVDKTGIITCSEEIHGAHAIAIVGYDTKGFWFQNSWGTKWGKNGLAHISYDDWLANAKDTWVCRLGVPMDIELSTSTATLHSAAVPRSNAASLHDLRRHIVSIGNNGRLKTTGDYGTSPSDVDNMVAECKETLSEWQNQGKTRRVLLYAHGGLVDEATAVQVLADFLPVFMAAGVYPISFIWHSDFWTTLKNMLSDATCRRRPEGFIDSAKDFMLDRLDDALEPLARVLGGKAQWCEMKENAVLATAGTDDAGVAVGGARYLADRLEKELGGGVEYHLIGHSAGSIFHAPLVQYLATKGVISSGPMARQKGLGVPIKSCTLWAPACDVRLFKESYLPLIGNQIEKFSSFILNDEAEEDDNCAHIYNKSLLYLVSDAFEEEARIPFVSDGWPIFGMNKFIKKDAELSALFKSGKAELVLAPNTEPAPVRRSNARHHGDFDNDKATITATLQRITGVERGVCEFAPRKPSAALRDIRRNLQR